MTKLQKLNLIKCTRDGYSVRLTELRNIDIPINSALWKKTKIREESLQQAIRFCDYIKLTVTRDSLPSTETRQMLEYIGLQELCEEPKYV